MAAPWISRQLVDQAYPPTPLNFLQMQEAFIGHATWFEVETGAPHAPQQNPAGPIQGFLFSFAPLAYHRRNKNPGTRHRMTMPNTLDADNAHPTTLRVEDAPLIRGEGRFIDDRRFPNQAGAVFVRSPHPHARIGGISTESALAMPDVVAVLTAADMETVGTVSRPMPMAGRDGKMLVVPERPPLARDRAKHVGDAVVLVIAETAAIAADAAELIEIDYEPLPAVADARAALAEGAPEVWPEAPGSLALDFVVPNDDGTALAEVEGIIATAAHVVTNDTINQRLAGVPLEPRGATAIYDHDGDRYILHCPSQSAGVLAGGLAAIMGVEPDKIRVLTPDVGGAFGLKTPPYPEYPALLIAAWKIGRPVHWMATRAESFLSDHQARDQHCRASLAIDKDGKFLALKIEATTNIGAYCTQAGTMISTNGFAGCLPTTYDIPKMSVGVRCVLTNSVPVGPYRGAGRPEANYVMERLVDSAARQIGLDPFELRRRNFIAPQALPYKTAAGHTFDSGDFLSVFEQALELSDATSFEIRRKASADVGRLRGLGVSCFLEHSGVFPTEGTSFVFEGDTLRVRLGVQASGQGHATVFRNVVADRLGISRDDVVLEEGDSDFGIKGWAAVASRSAMSAGPAMAVACERVVEKGHSIAADMLEVSAADIGYEGGTFGVFGTDRRVGLFDVARRAAELAENGSPRKVSTRGQMSRQLPPIQTGATSPRSRSIPKPVKPRLPDTPRLMIAATCSTIRSPTARRSEDWLRASGKRSWRSCVMETTVPCSRDR